jgi:uncharacterized protein (TIRG00374 family)
VPEPPDETDETDNTDDTDEPAGPAPEEVGETPAAADAVSPPRAAEKRSSDTRRRYLWSALRLIVAGVALYLFLPTVLSYGKSWQSLRTVDWRFATLALVLQVASWVWVWQLDRITLRHDSWFDVACSVSAGNALGRIVPGSATPQSVAMLGDAGVGTGQAVAGLTTSTLLQVGTALALPILAVPAIIAGAPVDHGLLTATFIGLAVLVVVVIVGTIVMRSDGLLEWIGQHVERVLNATVYRRHPVKGIDKALLGARNFVRETLQDNWRAALLAAAANTLFDYFSLLASLRAAHADPRPSLVLLAYAAAEVLSQIPITPGGLGFVEAGLVGTLTLAGVKASDATVATLLYRSLSYWLPIPFGGVTYLVFRRRYPEREDPAPAEPTG